MRGLTDRQREVLRCIHDDTRRRNRPPTIRRIGELMGIGSTNGVVCHLQYLARKGCVVWRKGERNGVRITAAGFAALGEPTDVARTVTDFALRGGDLGALIEEAQAWLDDMEEAA